jgi:hypothetical protein
MRIFPLQVILLLNILWGEPLYSQKSQVRSELQLKAAFLLKTLRYVTWPADSVKADSTPTTLVIVGNRKYLPVIRKLAVSLYGPDSINVKFCRDLEEIEGADIIFLSKGEGPTTQMVVRRFYGKPVLIVSEKAWDIRYGVHLAFFWQWDYLCILANPRAFRRSHLKVSSRLLRLAVIWEK